VKRGAALALTLDVETVALTDHIARVMVDSSIVFSKTMSVTVPFYDVRFEVEDEPDQSETLSDPMSASKLRLHLPLRPRQRRAAICGKNAVVMSISEKILASVQSLEGV
jgi:hypothetical protein